MTSDKNQGLIEKCLDWIWPVIALILDPIIYFVYFGLGKHQNTRAKSERIRLEVEEFLNRKDEPNDRR